MRTRFWLAGLLLMGLCVAWGPPPAQAAIWPFSMFGGKKVPVKRPKPKRPRPGAWPTPGYGYGR
ncbi:MAG TPA: hypothetical protein VKA46_09950 [Gemmataceae bacterium]|nr:hypothetical protein [Gemmataceae bacterium]